jgi:hypothetical protein
MAPRKVSLTALANDPDVTAAAAPAPAVNPTEPAVDLRTSGSFEVAKAVAAASPAPVAIAAPRRAHYSDYLRKETRLRADQLDALAAIARRLNRSRPPDQPRITENSLIRVAVDLLLSQERLAGSTEDDIRTHLLRRT